MPDLTSMPKKKVNSDKHDPVFFGDLLLSKVVVHGRVGTGPRTGRKGRNPMARFEEERKLAAHRRLITNTKARVKSTFRDPAPIANRSTQVAKLRQEAKAQHVEDALDDFGSFFFAPSTARSQFAPSLSPIASPRPSTGSPGSGRVRFMTLPPSPTAAEALSEASVASPVPSLDNSPMYPGQRTARSNRGNSQAPVSPAERFKQSKLQVDVSQLRHERAQLSLGDQVNDDERMPCLSPAQRIKADRGEPLKLPGVEASSNMSLRASVEALNDMLRHVMQSDSEEDPIEASSQEHDGNNGAAEADTQAAEAQAKDEYEEDEYEEDEYEEDEYEEDFEENEPGSPEPLTISEARRAQTALLLQAQSEAEEPSGPGVDQRFVDTLTREQNTVKGSQSPPLSDLALLNKTAEGLAALQEITPSGTPQARKIEVSMEIIHDLNASLRRGELPEGLGQQSGGGLVQARVAGGKPKDWLAELGWGNTK